MRNRCGRWFGVFCLLGGVCVSGAGCLHPKHRDLKPVDVPRELNVVSLPPYVIEPPDILLIDALRVVPKPPYRIAALDSLLIQVTNTLPDDPISGIFGVDPNGKINLGLAYGNVSVAGLTLEEAQKTITEFLGKYIKDHRVTVALSQTQGMQQVRGQHIVRQDGTVGLGIYGSVYVAGMTLVQAKYMIEQHLSRYLLNPEISLDIYSYNSKYYYVITDGAGYGQRLVRQPITGKETVLDALSQINGLTQVSSTTHIWVARPNGADPCQTQILPVDWKGITECGSPQTNYQLMAGDRVFVAADGYIRTNNALIKLLNPFNQFMGGILLGFSGISTVDATVLQLQSGNGGLFGGGPISGATGLGTTGIIR